MTRLHLTNGKLVLPDEMLANGSLLIEGDRIAAICPESVSGPFHEIDLNGSILMPGMIDIHCDAIETMAEPRNGIFLPFELAVQQIDRIAAGNGITTFYCAVSFAGKELGLRDGDAPSRLVRAIRDYRPSSLADLKIHCRYEVTVEDALSDILQFLDDGDCEFVSYMDHSPGQGQFQDEENYRSYMATRYGYGDEAITQLLESKRSVGTDRRSVFERVTRLAERTAACGVPLAGHDPDSEGHIQEMVSLGAVIAEFPMSMTAAKAAKSVELHQSVGAVNVIRGGSQRTGMSAMQLIESGLADCLCSDYVPATLLPAMLKVCRQLDRPMHEVARIVTSYPAKAMGLQDRGSIAVGKRADLVAFKPHATSEHLVELLMTLCRGRIVYCQHLPFQ